MKTLILILLLIAGVTFAQKDSPPEFSNLTPAKPRAIFDDSTNVLIWEITIANDTATASDALKIYEIIPTRDTTTRDTVLLRVLDCKTGIEDTAISKTGVTRTYKVVQPIVGRIMVKLTSATTVDLFIRKRKNY
jgi:hypothetical protein